MSKIFEVNVETGETIERNLTLEEKAEAAKVAEEFAVAKAAEETRKNNKQALLSRLGITEDEAKLLLS